MNQSILLSEAKSQVRQFLATRYRAGLEESPTVDPEERASIEVLTGELEDKADWNLAELTESPDLCSLARIRGDNGRLLEAGFVVNESASSLVVDFWSSEIRGVDLMRTASLLEVRIGALE